MSKDSFDLYVMPEIRVVRKGRLILVPVSELEKFLAINAAVTLQIDYPNERR
jgi:hypothetical protein